MTPDKPPALARSRLTLMAIVLLFVGPIVVAWLLASGRIDVHSRKLVNQGELLTPPIDLTPRRNQPGLAPLFKLAPSDWAIVYLEPEACAARCSQALDDLLVVRELLGQGAVRTSVHAISAAPPADAKHANRVQADPEALQWLKTELTAHASTRPLPAVVLVDWRHQLMLRYDPDEKRAIQKDLKRLLRASAIR